MDNRQKGCALGCGILTAIFAIVMMAGTTWMRRALLAPPPSPPSIPARTALRPTFVLKNGRRFSAGTAVAVRLRPDGEPILLTALHLFGPDGGEFQKYTPPAQIAAVLDRVELRAMDGGEVLAVARQPLRTTGPTLDKDDPYISNDVAAFALEAGTKVPVLPLAPENPSLFRWAWLVGDVYSHQPQSQRMFAGRVVASQDRASWLKFEEKFPLRAMSGAPIVNAESQVTGLLLRGFPSRGMFIPASAIRKRLAESGVQ